MKAKITTFLVLLVLGGAAVRGDDKPAVAKARAKFEKADTELNSIYKALAAQLDKAGAAKLREDERAWIQYRDDMSESAPSFMGNGTVDEPKSMADYWEAMTTFTRDRIEFLRVYTGKDVPQGITGEYSDCYGASLKLEETKKGVLFDLVAVRGHSASNGELSGVLQPKDGKAYFKQQRDPGDGEKPCELVFTFIEGHIVKIEQKTPDPDAGNGVYYDGEYYKTRKLAGHIKAE